MSSRSEGTILDNTDTHIAEHPVRPLIFTENPPVTKTRLEAFSDGVIAIIITIMVLELKTPHGTSWEEIRQIFPVLMGYALSFIVIGIYWGNHHHLLHTVSHINSRMIWANLHLLFWLSLIPFATAWMNDHFSSLTIAVYAFLLDLCGVAYSILLNIIRKSHPRNEALLLPLEKQTRKGILSVIGYTLAIPLAFVHTYSALALIFLVSVMWWIPDSNIERTVKQTEDKAEGERTSRGWKA